MVEQGQRRDFVVSNPFRRATLLGDVQWTSQWTASRVCISKASPLKNTQIPLRLWGTRVLKGGAVCGSKIKQYFPGIYYSHCSTAIQVCHLHPSLTSLQKVRLSTKRTNGFWVMAIERCAGRSERTKNFQKFSTNTWNTALIPSPPHPPSPLPSPRHPFLSKQKKGTTHWIQWIPRPNASLCYGFVGMRRSQRWSRRFDNVSTAHTRTPIQTFI